MIEAIKTGAGAEATQTTPEAKLKQACQDFEGIFLGLVVKQMRATVQHDGILPESFAQQTFEEMWTQEVVNSSTHTSTLGLAEMLARSLTGASSAEEAATATRALADTKGLGALLAAVRTGGGSPVLSAGEGEEGTSSVLTNIGSRKLLPAAGRHARPTDPLASPPGVGEAVKAGLTRSGKPLPSTTAPGAIPGETGTSPR